MPGNESTSQLAKIAGYTEILAKDPRSTVFVPLCEAYRQMGMLDDALEVARKGVQTLPKFSPGYAILGRVHAQRGQNDQAVAAFEKALSMDEENLTALKGLITLRLKKGEKALARPLLERVVNLKPDDKKAVQLLASLTPSKPEQRTAPSSPPPERTQVASDDMQETEPIATSTIAEIYIRQGFPKRALKVYRDLLDADPHNEDIRRKLILLKKRIEEESVAAPQSDAAGDIPEADQTDAPQPDKEPQAMSSTESSVVMSPSERAIAALNRHLEAIRQRRDHVQ